MATASRSKARPRAKKPEPEVSSNGRGTRASAASRAALDVLLTDAAVGNPASRLVRSPGQAITTAAKVVGRPDRVGRRAAELARELGRVARGTSELAPRKGDRRWADPAWRSSWLFRRIAQAYLATGIVAEELIDDAGLAWRDETAAHFIAGNIHDLLAPTNFPWSNPTVLKETLDQGGANLVKGLRRAGRDAAARRLPAMVDTSRFEVGGNLAVSKGSVVLRTDVLELMHYAPTTPEVREIPLLLIPPTINKFYILDLAPGRSMIEYLVGRGQQVFAISWRNPGQPEGQFDFDTYAAAIRDARDVVADITKQPSVNLSAGCSGGIVTAGLLAHLADSGELREVNSMTLLVCALDAEHAGTASALARRELAAAAVANSASRGYVDGKALGDVFAWLRPNDLVWGYVVNNYYLGNPPPAFDILYWNQDDVRLAAGLHRDFVMMALDNTMAKPGGMTVLGSPVDLGAVDIDLYAVAGLNDHIVPWENAYRGARLFGGSRRFVLSTSGHIQALVNPPSPESRSSFRVSDELPASTEQFVADVPTVPGSWWPDYVAWLAERSGDPKAAPKTLGNARHKPTAKAPGSYVHAT